MNDILYLGSQSASRQKLLREVDISFVVVPHSSEEAVERGNLSFDQYVMEIAKEKMSALQLPNPSSIDKKYIYVLTADTLVHLVSSGRIMGKPKDREDAKNMMRSMRGKEVEVTTGCCLRRYSAQDQQWYMDKEIVWATGAIVEFWVDEDFLDRFYDKEPIALVAAGAAIIEGYGQMFFKRINGSHSSVVGLPLFELRQELTKMGFVF